MSAPIKKAMVLTAGLGTRLSPITQKIPKPLVAILNVPNILHVIYILKNAGVNNIVMNLFHLSEEMESFFRSKRFEEINFQFTYEDPIQGTGGGVKNAEPFLKGSSFVLANCDFVTDINISKHIENHFRTKAIASMLLIQDPARAHLYSKVGVDSSFRLVSLPKLETKPPEQTGIFTGIHILNTEVFDFLESRPCGINDVLYPKLMKSCPNFVYGFIDHQASWYDTGDIPAFFQTSRQLLQRLNNHDQYIVDLFKWLKTPYEEALPKVWVEKGCSLPSKLKIEGPAVIGKNVAFGKNCYVGPYTIIGDNCYLEDSSSVQDSVLLSGSRVFENSKLSYVIQFNELSIAVSVPV